MGFEVAFNLMYLSEWTKDYKFLDQIIGIENYVGISIWSIHSG